MGRRWIGIEMGEHARTHCVPRLEKVLAGEQGGISGAVGWQGGGGFRFARLGDAAFTEDGRINPSVRFSTLASYLWFLETGTPHATGEFTTPLLGAHSDTALILLYNGILGDRRPQGGNVLTQAVWTAILDTLPAHAGPRIIYGEACRLSPARLRQLGVTFKQIPYDIRMR
jgi:adenine-specific DNA-methyltransferase